MVIRLDDTSEAAARTCGSRAADHATKEGVMPSSPPPGIPILPPPMLRTRTISVRVNAREYAELTARRDAAGIKEMGAYLRMAVLAQQPPRAVVPTVNRAAWRELAHTASNLNQLTAHLNAGNLRDPGGGARLGAVLATLTAEVRWLRLTLLGIAPERTEDER